LNRKQKDITLTVGALVAFLEDRINEWQQIKEKTTNADRLQEIKATLKEARMTKSFGERLLDTFFVEVPYEEREKVIKAIKGRQVVVMPTLEAKREYQKMAEMDKYEHIEIDDFLDILDYTFQSCMRFCKAKGEKADNCKLKKILLKYHVEPLKHEVEPGECPFQMPKEVKNGFYV
jgi:seryl-tRNA synthetase